MFALTRSNRRKTTKARNTQVIDVPRFLIKDGLSEADKRHADFINSVGGDK